MATVRLKDLLLVTLLGSGRAFSQDVPDGQAAIGCYRATPALTYSAFGEPERGDTSWAILRLSSDGRARRPLLRGNYDGSSRWSWRRDTLVVRLFDGLVGWDAALTRDAERWRGSATYLTDARGGQRVVRPLVLERRACDGLPNTALLLPAPNQGSALLAALAGATVVMPRSRTRFR
jgi:hypothetical protein